MISLQDIYIGSTIFSAGITVLDFVGILGHHDDGDAAGDHDGGHADAGGGHVLGDFHTEADDMSGDAADGGDDVSAEGGHDHADGEAEAAHHTDHGGAAVLSVLSYLRSVVYFCLGFGPTGWVAMTTGRSAPISLAWALPAGVVAFFLARAFFRFQRQDTDSTLKFEDMLFQQATVTIPMTNTKMGRVRVQVGMNVTEQFALASQPGMSFQRGDIVRITNVDEDCLHVDDDLTTKE